MKTKLTLLFLALSGLLEPLHAAQVPVSTAALVAENIYRERISALNGTVADQVLFGSVITLTEDNVPVIYVFNLLDGKGFVMIAAHDNVHPVLAYTFNGTFSEHEQQPAFSDWIKNYREQIAYCVQNDLPADESINKEWELYGTENKLSPPQVQSVGPLLTTTWNQGCNYNAQCPVVTGGQCGKAWTGCGATAMAQVMKYHNHPLTGTGSHSYSWSSQLLSANFGATTYNWSNMPNNVTSANTDVAQLMYHCGVALDMNYGASGSYCSFDFSYIMPQYFGYAATAQNWLKLFVPNDTTYQDRLAGELDSLRPMPYKGSGSGTHFFVCDGYQNSYPYHFHFNWGWGGLYDGYFYISALNPGTYSFTNSQGAVIRVMPAQLTTSLAEPEPSAVQVYPNPASETVFLTFENTGRALVTVYDVAGKEALTAEITASEAELNISNLSPGIYMIRVKTGSAVISKKLVVH
ncbi:MAG: thiol protease/hemagglutinin PrtT [Bacteroidota bacterium]